MKKRYILIFLSLLMVSIIALAIIGTSDNKIDYPDNAAKAHIQEEHDKTDDQEDNTSPENNQEQEKTKDESKETAKTFGEKFNDLVKNTIHFFSNEKTHVTAIGDSLTQGVGDEVTDGGYVDILDDTINQEDQLVTFDNFGKRGNRSDQLLKRLENPDIRQSMKDADIVLLTIGANDIMQVVKENVTDLTIDDFQPAKKTYIENLTQIFDQIKKVNETADIYLVGFYNPFGHYFPNLDELDNIVDEWNQKGENLTEEYSRTTFIPTDDLFASDQTNLFADDHFHPSHHGYQLIAKRVLDYITED